MRSIQRRDQVSRLEPVRLNVTRVVVLATDRITGLGRGCGSGNAASNGMAP